MEAIKLTTRIIQLCREMEIMQEKNNKIVADLKKQITELQSKVNIFKLGNKTDYKRTQK